MERSLILLIRAAIVTLAIIFTQNTYAQSPTAHDADLLVSPSMVSTAGNPLIAVNGSQAKLRDNSDQKVLDLSDAVSLGSNYTVRWRKDPETSSEQMNIVKASANVYAEIPFTSANTIYDDAVNSKKIMPLEL